MTLRSSGPLVPTGALVALEEEGLHPCAIAANSTAAILGALYAAGNAAQDIESIVRAIDIERPTRSWRRSPRCSRVRVRT